MTDERRRNLDTFMHIAQLVAAAEAESISTTPRDEVSAQAASQLARDRLAALRRNELANQPTNVVSGAIRPSIQRLTREQVLAELHALSAAHPDLQVAYRDLAHVSDDDVRSALEDARSLLEREQG